MDALALRDNAKQQLEQIKTVETGFDYLNKVKAIETWAKAEKKDAELQNLIAEQKIRTQRILGKLIQEGQERKEIASQKSNSFVGNQWGVTKEDTPKTLSEIGITRNQSSTFKKIASIPDDVFESELKLAKEESEKRVELTTSRVLQVAKKLEREKDIQRQKQDIEKENTIPELKGLYDVISVDPPWPYDGNKNTYDPNGRRVANPYPEMSIDEIIKNKPPFKENAICFLWTTHKFLPDSFEILKQWGFDYKATLVWDKEKIGMGHWFRMQCEFVLFAVKGNVLWNNTTERDILKEAKREHSRKPDAFFDMVDKICVGKKLEFYSREKREGWDNFGNETEKF